MLLLASLLFACSVSVNSFFLFFFSSRRRHTRWPRDWSSDVCSSDLRKLSPAGSTISLLHCFLRSPLQERAPLQPVAAKQRRVRRRYIQPEKGRRPAIQQ